MSLKLLDCTLRDGGYYNHWDFEYSFVQKYLDFISQTGVDIVEIGFRTYESVSSFHGPLAFSSDHYIASLNLSKHIDYAVMINAKEFTGDRINNLDNLFCKQGESLISIVRVAVNFEDFKQAEQIVIKLHKFGYRVFLNIMQCGIARLENLSEISKVVKTWPVEVLYFADSFGNMTSDQVKSIVQLFNEQWLHRVGFHPHDNMGQALVNSQLGLEMGISYLDCTLLGMGRGAGNLSTEVILMELSRKYPDKYNYAPAVEFSMTHMIELKNRYRWGVNPYYYLAASLGIHPSYVQSLLQLENLNSKDIIAAIQYLAKAGGKNYEKSSVFKALDNDLNAKNKNLPSRIEKFDDFQSQHVLIIADTPGARKHAIGIQQYIINHKPFVIALNSNTIIDSKKIDLLAACNPLRISKVNETLQSMGISRILCPDLGLISPEYHDDIIKFRMEIEPHSFSYNNEACFMPAPLVLFYAIFYSLRCGSKKILLAGLDGYESNDFRRDQIVLCFEKLKNLLDRDDEIYAVTPSTYNIQQRSIYEYDI